MERAHAFVHKRVSNVKTHTEQKKMAIINKRFMQGNNKKWNKSKKNNNKLFTRAFNNMVQSSPCIKNVYIPNRFADRDRSAKRHRHWDIEREEMMNCVNVSMRNWNKESSIKCRYPNESMWMQSGAQFCDEWKSVRRQNAFLIFSMCERVYEMSECLFCSLVFVLCITLRLLCSISCLLCVSSPHAAHKTWYIYLSWTIYEYVDTRFCLTLLRLQPCLRLFWFCITYIDCDTT